MGIWCAWPSRERGFGERSWSTPRKDGKVVSVARMLDAADRPYFSVALIDPARPLVARVVEVFPDLSEEEADTKAQELVQQVK